eukprot:scaffold225562_cov21-Tisochrysis_lutea.AAC.1
MLQMQQQVTHASTVVTDSSGFTVPGGGGVEFALLDPFACLLMQLSSCMQCGSKNAALHFRPRTILRLVLLSSSSSCKQQGSTRCRGLLHSKPETTFWSVLPHFSYGHTA